MESDEMAVCGAQLRRKPGVYCRKQAMQGRNRCRLHGGASLRGVAHPGAKDLRYSKDLPADLKRRYEEAQRDPNLIELRAETALIDALIAEQLKELRKGRRQLDRK